MESPAWGQDVMFHTAPQDIQMYGRVRTSGQDKSGVHCVCVTIRVLRLIFSCPLQCVHKEQCAISHPLFAIFLFHVSSPNSPTLVCLVYLPYSSQLKCVSYVLNVCVPPSLAKCIC